MFRNPSDKRKIAKKLGYKFKDNKLLLQALTRKSALNEGLQKAHIGHFQRLEFLGDRVLNLVISDLVYSNNPKWNEGQLTVELNKWINNKGPLAEIALLLKLDQFLIMGKGEEDLGMRQNQKVLSDTFEALLGALWLDSQQDFEFIRSFLVEQYKAIGLKDFKLAAEEAIIIQAIARDAVQEIFEIAMPELYEGRDEGRDSFVDALRLSHIAQKARNTAHRRRLLGQSQLPGLVNAYGRFFEGTGVDEEQAESELSPTDELKQEF
jgi:ribonuclease-3